MKITKEVLFWLVVLVALSIVFGYRINDFTGSFLFTTFLMPVLIGTSYTFSELLIPRYLLARRYGRFILYAFYAIIITLNLTILTMVLSFTVIANYRFDNMLPASRDVFGLAIVILFIALIKSSWKLVRQLFIQESELNKFAEKAKLQQQGYLNVKSNRREYRLNLDDISYIESLADYIKIHEQNGNSTISKEKISALSERLPANFIRIHRSYLINLDQVNRFSSESVYVNETELPIGRKYKPNVKQVLKNPAANP